MNDEEFEIYYGDEEPVFTSEDEDEHGDPDVLMDLHNEIADDYPECEAVEVDAEEFERAVLRYAKVKKVSFDASTMLMAANPDLVREWGVR